MTRCLFKMTYPQKDRSFYKWTQLFSVFVKQSSFLEQSLIKKIDCHYDVRMMRKTTFAMTTICRQIPVLPQVPTLFSKFLSTTWLWTIEGGNVEWETIVTSGVNFTNPLVRRTNAPAHRVWRQRCHSVSPTKLCPNLPVHTTRSYAQLLHFMLYAMCKKISVSLLAQKLVVKWWWKWHQRCWKDNWKKARLKMQKEDPEEKICFSL